MIRFAGFHLDPQNAMLKKGSVPLKLRPQAFRILCLIAENAGQLVTRDRIRQEIWGDDTFVDFNQGLNACIKQIREALGDSAEAPQYIETIPRLGYRFVAPVTRVLDEQVAVPEVVPAAVIGSSATADIGDHLTEAAADPPSGMLAARTTRIAPQRWVVAIGLLVLLGAAGGVAWKTQQAPRSIDQPIRSVAVLPLDNLSEDTAEYLAEGMTDALITDLAKIGSLKVISRTSVLRYNGQRQALPEIARELGVDAIVEGSLKQVGDRVRINVQLVHGATDHHLWAQTYERQLGDILMMERDIARAVALAVRGSLTPDERARLTTARAVDPIVYEAYLKGRHFWNDRSADSLETAVKYFNEAIQRDPTYAPAYAGLADCYVLGPGARMPANEAYAKARAAATKALELDPGLAEAHSALGLVEMFWDWDMASAGERFKRAIALNPGYATARQMHAEYLAITGKMDAAMAEIERARELDPFSLIIRRDVGRIHYFARRYDAAAAALRDTLAIDATFTPARFLLAFAYERDGRRDEALAEFERMVNSSGGRALFKGALGYMYGISGNSTAAGKLVEELTEPAGGRRPPSYDVALIYLGLGDRSNAFAWLERAADERSYRIPYAAIDPIFDSLRTDARFQRLLHRAGLSSSPLT